MVRAERLHAGDPAAGVPAVAVDVLGPLRLTVQGVPVDVPGHRRRAVLALLALGSGSVVTVDALIDAVWPDDPPDSGRRALHSHISRVRRHLGAGAPALRRHDSGYALQLDDDAVDAVRVRRLAKTVRDLLPAEPARAAATARTALALWRGDALVEFVDVGPLAAEAVGLAELRWQLRDDALEARLAAGERDVTVDATAAVLGQPLRERTVQLLMLALARESRAAEAMAAAAAYRRRLADETGLDPGAAIAALEQEIAGGLVDTVESVSDPAPRRRVLPRPAGPLIGRDDDREELHRLLVDQPTVTITGPGGVGKTRLAMEIAADLSAAGSDVVVVPLAEVADESRVIVAIVTTLGLRTTEQATAAAVADAVAGRDTVLVLDNCEHVVGACRELVACLQERASGVRILATSRVTLQVPGEYVVRLQPLPLPRGNSEVAALVTQPSVRAFLEHARRRQTGFSLTDDNRADVVEIIRRLDGLPLALELAAGQLAVLPIRALRDRLGGALDALSAERPQRDARHRTLRTTIEWSYRLLQSDDRALLRAMAAFPGGVDLTTVEDAEVSRELSRDPVLALGRLVDASLVSPDAAAPGRFRLLETVRAFVHDDLETSGDAYEAESRFLRWARRAAVELGAALAGPAEPAADRRLRAELANLRAAWDIAKRRGNFDAQVEMTLALDEPAIWRDIMELWAWSVDLAEDPHVRAHPNQIAILGSAAEAHWLLGDLDGAERLSRRALELPVDAASLDASRRAWSAAAAVALFRGDHASARSHYLRGAEAAPRPAAHLTGAALAALYDGDAIACATFLASARASLALNPSPTDEAFIEYVHGESLASEDPWQAEQAYRAAVEAASRSGARFIEGIATVGLASLWASTGEVAKAVGGYQLLLGYWERTGSATQFWTTVRNAARLLAERGDHRTALLLYLSADSATSAAALTGEEATRVHAEQRRLRGLLGTATVAELIQLTTASMARVKRTAQDALERVI